MSRTDVPWPEAALVAGEDRSNPTRPSGSSLARARLDRSRGGRALWVPRPWWSRLAAGSAVPPPGVVPAVFLLGAGACVGPGLTWRALGASVALAAGACWLLSATAWVRLSRRGVLWRHLGTVRRLPWSAITGCATVWVPQGRKQVRVVAIETEGGGLEILWPTAWIGEANRRALVATCQRYRFGPARSAAPH